MRSLLFYLAISCSFFISTFAEDDGESSYYAEVESSIEHPGNCSDRSLDVLNHYIRKNVETLKDAAEPIVQKGACKHFDKFLKSGVPANALKQALKFYESNGKEISHKRYLTIADYSQHSGKDRFFLLDLETGDVSLDRVSHGSGKVKGVNYGDRAHNGMLDSCRIPKGVKAGHNQENMTRPGFFVTKKKYVSTSHSCHSAKYKKYNCDEKKYMKATGKSFAPWWPDLSDKEPFYNGLRIKGLTPKVNDLAESQGVVMHGANYNRPEWATMGRSYGCPAFEPGVHKKIIDKIEGGSLYYSFVPKCSDDMKIVLEQVKGWESTCSK